MTVLTACKTVYAEPAVQANEALLALIPEVPDLPAWPELDWQYKDGCYSLSEADIDKVLNYWENEIPMYQYNMKMFKEKLAIVMDHL